MVKGKLGRRGCFLLFLTQLDYIYGLSLLLPTPSSLKMPQNIFLMAIMPLWIWGSLWVIVGATCMIFAFRAHDGIGYAAAMFIKVLWGTVFFLGWIFSDIERAYLTSTIWCAFAAVVYLVSTWPDDVKEALR
jgi:hypothetical protein